MKRNNLLFLFLLFFVTSCKDKKSQPVKSENNIDAARNFIRAALDGKFNVARTYMLADSINTNYMDVVERAFQNTDKATKDGYRTSSINILNLSELIKDSITMLIYSNSFKNDPDTLKVIKANGQWLVDLKYLYQHDADTLMNKPNIIDTLQ